MNMRSINAGIASVILITTLSACSTDETATGTEFTSTPAATASNTAASNASTSTAAPEQHSEPEELVCVTCGVTSSNSDRWRRQRRGRCGWCNHRWSGR